MFAGHFGIAGEAVDGPEWRHFKTVPVHAPTGP